MQKITPFLWFDNQAEEAANFYASIFPDSRILSVTRYGDGAPQPKGSVMTVAFQLRGQTFVGLNGGPLFPFTEAVSFAVNCDPQDEIDHFWEKLCDGGQPVECGWLKDKYGLSWQIVPSNLGELVAGPDEARTQRVMGALMQMKKLDMHALQRAYDAE